jgi:hypothetical protein
MLFSMLLKYISNSHRPTIAEVGGDFRMAIISTEDSVLPISILLAI